jgi:hypothetical protein
VLLYPARSASSRIACPELRDFAANRRISNYVETIPDRVPLSGELQGRCLVLAGELRELAGLLEAA